MKQSVYTKISKELGHRGYPIPPPTKEIAQGLLNEMNQLKPGLSFFEVVFKLHRHCRSGETEEEIEAMNLIQKAFIKGRSYFEKQYITNKSNAL